jgi:hypothetical protein
MLEGHRHLCKHTSTEPYSLTVKGSLNLRLNGICPRVTSPVGPPSDTLLITPRTTRFELHRFRLLRLLPRSSHKHEAGRNLRGITSGRRGPSEVKYNPTTDDAMHDPNQGWNEPAVRRLHGQRGAVIRTPESFVCEGFAYWCQCEDKDGGKAQS